MPAKTSQILSPLVAAQFEIEQAQQRVGIGIGKGPGPIATLAFQVAEAGYFLQQQSVPVAIGYERFDAKAALRQMVFIPIL